MLFRWPFVATIHQPLSSLNMAQILSLLYHPRRPTGACVVADLQVGRPYDKAHRQECLCYKCKPVTERNVHLVSAGSVTDGAAVLARFAVHGGGGGRRTKRGEAGGEEGSGFSE